MREFLESYPFADGRGAHALLPSDHIDAVFLAANTLHRHTIPAGARYVMLYFEGGTFVKYGDASITVSVPVESTNNGQCGEQNPSVRRVPSTNPPTTHVAIISPTACKGTIAFYA